MTTSFGSTMLTDARYRALRLRHDWWFRWAHDPLCDRLGGGVLQVGKLRLCRSCVAMYTGVAVGTAVALTRPTLGARSFAPYAWLAAAAGAGVVSTPTVYRRLDRRAKDGVRSTTGVIAGMILCFARLHRWKWFATLAVFAASAYRYLTLARAAQKATACDGCPELGSATICSGYAQQAVSLRAYEEAASALATSQRARSQSQPLLTDQIRNRGGGAPG